MAELLGMELSNSKVPTTRCPLCKLGTMYAFPDIDTAGRWWYCDQCQTSSSSVQLYQQVHGQDLRTAWYNILHQSGLEVPAYFRGPAALDDYNAWLNGFEHVQSFAAGCRRELDNLPPMSVEVLQSMGVWSGKIQHTLRYELGRYLGALSKDLIEQLGQRTKVTSIRRGCNGALVLIFEGLPGVLSSAVVMSRTQMATLVFRAGDSGIMGLSDAMKFGSPLFAVVEPLLFLQMQSGRLHDSNEPLPMVCLPWGDLGRATVSLECLPQPKIVFWGRGKSIACMEYARRLGSRGWLAMSPELPEDGLASPLQLRSAHQLAHQWHESARPWAEALKLWLLSSSPTEAARVAGTISPLNKDELASLRACCKDGEWDRINALLSAENLAVPFSYRGESFVCRPGLGWYKINQRIMVGRDPESLVTDAEIRVEAVSASGDELYMSGTVEFKGSKISFTGKASDLRKDPATWLEALCVSRECGMPFIDARYRKHLMNMSTTLYSPKVMPTVKRVGWNAARAAWEFPGFDVVGGELQAKDMAVCPPGIPGGSLPLLVDWPDEATLNCWLGNGLRSEITLSLMCAISWNLLEAARGRHTAGIGVIRSSPLAELAIYETAQGIGLLSAVPPKAKNEEFDRLAAEEHKHDLPIMLRSLGPANTPLANWIRFMGPRNCIVALSPQEAVNVCLMDRWVLIRGDGPSWSDDDAMRGSEALLPLLMRELHRSMTAGTPPATPLEVVDLLKKSLGPRARLAGESLERVKGRMVLPPDEDWRRFLWTVFWAVTEGKVEVRPDGAKGKPSPIASDTDGAILVDWSGLAEKLLKAGILIPDHDALNQLINQGEPAAVTVVDGRWKLPKPLFDSVLSNYRTVFCEDRPHDTDRDGLADGRDQP